MARSVAVFLLLGALPGMVVPALAQDESVPMVVTCLHPGQGAYQLLCELFKRFHESGDEAGFVVELADSVPSRSATSGALEERLQPIRGSMDILDTIAQGKNQYFMGLTQSDVAYYFRHGGHPLIPSPHPLSSRVVALARAFPEYFHVYVEGGDAQPSFEGLRTEAKELAAGVLGSGTLVTSTNLLPTLFGTSIVGSRGQSPELIRRTAWPPEGTNENTSLSGQAQAEMLRARVFVSARGHPSLLKHLASEERGTVVPLSDAESRYIRSAFAHVYGTRSVDPYVQMTHSSQEMVDMVEVPALVVASKRLPGEVARRIGDFFRSIDADELEFPDVARAERLLSEVREYSDHRNGDLILQEHRETLRWPWRSQILEVLIAFLAIGIGLLLLRIAVRQLKEEGDIFKVSALVTGGIAVCICVAWLHLILFLVTWIENAFYRSYATDLESAFVGGSYSSLLPMVLHYIASAFSAEKLFPVSNSAQFLWLSIPLLIGASTFAGLVHVSLPPALNFLKKNLESGTRMQLSNHVVICNWHPYLPDIVRQLHEQAVMEGEDELAIVLITKDCDQISLPRLGTHRDESIGEHVLFAVPPKCRTTGAERIQQVVALEADPSEETVLNLAEIGRAFAIIVFPDAACPDPDGPTAMTVLTIDRFRGAESRTRLIVWCENPAHVENFLDPRFRISDVCSTEWAWRVICQATRVNHVSNIYRSLMTSTEESNEFYEVLLPQEFKSKSFAELQVQLIDYSRRDCQQVSARLEKRNTLLLVGYLAGEDQHRLDPQLNPPPEAMVQAGDYLLFLTYRLDRSIRQRLLSFLCSQAPTNEQAALEVDPAELSAQPS